jgi:sucrose-6-phosphate hydrolase SacC (GH32 family)
MNPDFVSDELALNYHLMHPGADSAPADPNAAFCIDGVYHLHYIVRHPWQDGRSFCFVHVTSPDLLHWTWQPTKLQIGFAGHGMFSGTGFITRDGRPAVIYHGEGSGRNQIAIATDNGLSAWEKPYAIEPQTVDGEQAQMLHWDPDCFQIGDTYYAISGGQNPPLIKSNDLRSWTLVGDFLRHDLPDVALGEDISCPNFFPLGSSGKWMLLCISHPFGCRYYMGDWDAAAEQFVPEIHGRMNWRRRDQSDERYVDIFAPETVQTADGRRVMWAWLMPTDEVLRAKSIQCLPRELSLAADGTLLQRPLRELEALRYDPMAIADIAVTVADRKFGGDARVPITELDGDACELRVVVDHAQAARKRFGLRLFADDTHAGLAITVHPEAGTVRLGNMEAPFSLAPDDDLELRVFVDRYLVELFVNERCVLATAHMDYAAADGVYAYAFGATTTIRSTEIWRLHPTNSGFLQARQDPVWVPDEA